MTADSLAVDPLRCRGCGAPVPLLEATSFACPFCHANIEVAPSYQELFEKNRLETRTRRQLEARYTHVSRVPSRRFDVLAIALVIVGPAITAAAYMAVATAVVSPVALLSLVIVPALLPGTVLWMWSASIHATVVRYQLALAARAPTSTGAAPCCRRCGAPLHVEDNAIFARCAYCGTDSLVTQLASALRRLDQALRNELETIQHAITALVYRRRLLVGGIAIAVTVLATLVVALLASVD